MAFGQWVDEIASGGGQRKSENNAKKAVRDWSRLEVPEFEDFNPDMYDYVGDFQATTVDPGDDTQYQDIDARLADFASVDRSEMGDISVDPRLKDAQMGSLAALDDIIAGGGMNLSDQANLAELQGSVSAEDRGRREAIMQGMAQRGMGGSGMELLQKLDSAQAATDRASQGGLDIAAMAQQRALDAIMNQGQLSGQMRGQDFGEQAQIAQAQDAIAQFNAQNQNVMNQYNTGSQNQMAQFNAQNQMANDQYNRNTNLGAQQFNANSMNQAGMYNNQALQNNQNLNTATRNEAQMHNKFTAPQQQFQNEATKAQGRSGARMGVSDVNMQQAKEAREWKKQEDQNAQSVMGGIGKMGGGF